MVTDMPLDPDATRILEAFRASGRPPYEAMTLDAARAAYAAGRAATVPEPHAVAETVELSAEGRFGAIPLRLYRPVTKVRSPLPALVYFHGGGWVFGDLDSHNGVCRHLAAGAACAVVSVGYRLAPENKFPAAVEDAIDATGWVRAHAAQLGLDPIRIGVGGDSAGGALAAVVCITLRDAGEPVPRCQLLIYPVTDLAMTTRSHDELAEGHLLTRASLLWFAGHYLTDQAERSDWRASPLRADSLADLPPSFVLTAGYDPLRDEGEAFAARLAASGVRVTTWRIPGQIHGFLPMGKVMSCAGPILDTLARYLALELA
jgi:acetyl esterase